MAEYRIPAEARMGPVSLIVRDLDRSLRFYRDLLGLESATRPDGAIRLAAGDEPLVILTERPDAPLRSPRSTGLYHFAILTPSRRELGRTLTGLADAGYPLQGASDHGVSEALYLADPEGNGIEIYTDRPRDEWPRTGDSLSMVTDPLDVEGVLGAAGADPGRWSGLPDGTRMGHIHLQVSHLPQSEAFYVGALGFDLVQRYEAGAAFLSAGGYHHHVGMNTWAGVGAPPPSPGAAGLASYTIILPGSEALDRAARRLGETGIETGSDGSALLLRDPSGNGIRLVGE